MGKGERRAHGLALIYLVTNHDITDFSSCMLQAHCLQFNEIVLTVPESSCICQDKVQVMTSSCQIHLPIAIHTYVDAPTSEFECRIYLLQSIICMARC